jgi:acyl carrier protein
VIGVADIAWGELRTRLPGLAAPFWSEMPASLRQEGSGESIRARIADLAADAATEVVLDILREELAGILKQAPTAIDANRPILEFGVDSLMAVELRTALEARLDVQLPLLALTSATTLRAMAARLLAAMQGGGEPARDDVAAAILRHEGAEAAPQPVAGK